jgi:fructosamine-3-kinase
LGDSSPVQSAELLGGGCINHAMRLQTARSQYLLKWNSDPLPGLFQAEADGLRRLAKTNTVRVPHVLAHAGPGPDYPAHILLEWLSGPPTAPADEERLGAQLAELHRQGTAPSYGLASDNYLGSVLQRNTWQTNWVTFFGKCRLLPQIELARRLGRLPTARANRLAHLLDHLDDHLDGVERRPALIHGDLWGGNVIPGPDGLAVIDPAVSYSDREAEIAYTQLFGGFSARFYAGYQSTWPLEPGYSRRRDLYNLYHLLNHLNHFGESYGPQVDQVLRAYA